MAGSVVPARRHAARTLPCVSDTPIGPYVRRPLAVEPWDPRTVEVAERVAALVNAVRPDLRVEHTGSSSVPGLPGKNVVDLSIETDPDDVPRAAAVLRDLGFQRQTNRNPWPPTRPMHVGSLEHGGARFPIHAHVLPRGHRVYGHHHRRDLAFRDALRARADLREQYAALKQAIIDAEPIDSLRYSIAKTEWIRTTLADLGVADPVILPPATIGILGGGQLGRMLALAARSMGYRIAILDPDDRCPAAAVADAMVVGAYDDVDAALRLAGVSDVITYELEHVAAPVVERLDWDWPVRPGLLPLLVTQDRLAERRFVESEGIAVAPWREVRTAADLAAAAEALGGPLRIKVATGGYDGRGQVRLERADPEAAEAAIAALGRPAGEPLLAERELNFAAELSVIVTQGIDGRATTFPVARNRHGEGILVESVTPAGVPVEVETAARDIARRLAVGMGLEGTLAVELFLLGDGSLVVNELAPRVHNTGHWTVDACRTSQFEQHVRAICGLPLGSVDAHVPAALANVLGTGARRAARVAGVERALADPLARLELYDKQEVFERRKMGHVIAVGATPDEALERARAAAVAIEWEA